MQNFEGKTKCIAGYMKVANSSFRQSQTKVLGHKVSSSPPPTFNADNRLIFSLFVGKNAIISNID